MEYISYQKKKTLSDIKNLRDQYLDGLIEPQELFLELFCRKAYIYEIMRNGVPIGYFFSGKDNTLYEYHLNDAFIHRTDDVLHQILSEFSVRKALCKSFDHHLMSCCLGLQKNTRVLGVLFREYREEAGTTINRDLRVRFAEEKDIAHIVHVNENVFETKDEITAVVLNKNVFIFENEEEIIGFGVFQRIIEGRPVFDLGMLVEKKYRKQGYGQAIIKYLRNYCSENGWRGICGCAVDNIASRKCLERAGYIGKHRMVEFTF